MTTPSEYMKILIEYSEESRKKAYGKPYSKTLLEVLRIAKEHCQPPLWQSHVIKTHDYEPSYAMTAALDAVSRCGKPELTEGVR